MHEDLLPHLEEGIEYIEAGLKKGAVLVHCQQGVSRSAIMVLAYLIRTRGFSLDTAMKRTSERRFIHPNSGFLRQLRSAECQLQAASIGPSHE